MGKKPNYDERKSKCDKRKKRSPYRHSSRRRYMLNGDEKIKEDTFNKIEEVR